MSSNLTDSKIQIVPSSEIQRIAVLGAGTMGAAIAAHLNNLGFSVSLIDLNMEKLTEGLDRAARVRPPNFTIPGSQQQINLVPLAEAETTIREADWVLEAIIENLEAKQNLLRTIAPWIRPDAYLSSNTSGIQIELLSEVLSPENKAKFTGTHFFNPPRYLDLLELIPTSATPENVIQEISAFLRGRVGRTVVPAKDTPGFIANRYGMWAIYQGIHTAEKLGFSAELVDSFAGNLLGRPKSALFRLCDVIGVDVMNDIATNLLNRCPSDPKIAVLNRPKSLQLLLEKGWLGEKSGQGYYRKEGKELLVYDWNTRAYRPKSDEVHPAIEDLKRLPLKERIVAGLKRRDELGEYFRLHLPPIVEYAQQIAGEVSHTIVDFDQVMKRGFGWEMGPFELADAISETAPTYYVGANFQEFGGNYVPVPIDESIQPVDHFPLVDRKETFDVRDLGDGAIAIATTTKMGVISPRLVDELTSYLSENTHLEFVLTSSAKAFSVGYDLNSFESSIESKSISSIETNLRNLQNLGAILETRNCVAAAFGFCIGAGYELALSCPTAVFHLETKIGLPEAKVGLIPGGRGNLLLRRQAGNSVKKLGELCGYAVQGNVVENAALARKIGFIRTTDEISYRTGQALSEAKAILLQRRPALSQSWTDIEGPVFGSLEQMVEELARQGKLTDYDAIIARKLIAVVAKSTSLEDLCEKEIRAFLELCERDHTLMRIKHMIRTGTAFRN